MCYYYGIANARHIDICLLFLSSIKICLISIKHKFFLLNWISLFQKRNPSIFPLSTIKYFSSKYFSFLLNAKVQYNLLTLLINVDLLLYF